MVKVKCVECGFLAVRDEYNDSVCEATQLTRTKGTHKSSNGNTTNANVFCYKDSSAWHSPEKSSLRSMHSPKSENKVISVLEQDKECALFCKWVPGQDPERIEETSWRQLALESQNRIAEFQGRIADLHDKHLEWRQRQAEQDDKFAKQIQALEETRHQEVRRDTARWKVVDFIVFGVIALVVSAVVQIISAFIERGTLFPDNSPVPAKTTSSDRN